MILSAFIGIPLLGAALISFWPVNTEAPSWPRRLALVIVSGVVLGILVLLRFFEPGAGGSQFQEFLPWIEPLGLSYSLGVDGLSLPLLALNALLTWVVVYSSDRHLLRSRLYYALILLVSAAISGAFLAQNLLLFFLFYELGLIPLYLLIAIWGTGKQGYAATKFLLYTAVSGILILAGFLGLVWLSSSTSFDYEVVKAITASIPLEVQLVLLGTLLVGFGIKTPLVPLHTWLPDTYVAASPPIAMLLGGVVAKLGTYGLFRFGLGLLPQAWSLLAPGLAIWAVVSVLYGTLSAIAQKDIKRMVAYSSIGHMGYVLLGGAALTELSLVGAVSQMVAHGLILALLFHLVGVVEAKVGTRDLEILNGLMNPIRGLPLVSGLLVLGGMASAGVPGLVGFITEFLVFQGSFPVFPWATLLCVVGTGFTAVYFVILLNRTCFGRLDSNRAYYPQVLWSERVPALVLATLILGLGVQPHWLLRWSQPTTSRLVAVAPASSNLKITEVSGLESLGNRPIARVTK